MISYLRGLHAVHEKSPIDTGQRGQPPHNAFTLLYFAKLIKKMHLHPLKPPENIRAPENPPTFNPPEAEVEEKWLKMVRQNG